MSLTVRRDSPTAAPSAVPAPLLPPATDGWAAAAAEGLSLRDQALYRSHLVGRDPSLTREGGGNFSAKGTARDHRGEPTPVLWMSSWGCDGATTDEDDFPPLRLDDLRLLRTSPPLSERDLLDFELACELTGRQRPPGIETMTHAFLPFAHVDHLHPEAVVVLTDIPDGRRLAEEEFGDEAIWFDYRQFDLGVAQEMADRVAARPGCRFILLANHGTFTWGDTSEECYRNSLEVVERANRALAGAVRHAPDLGGRAVQPPPRDVADRMLTELLPTLRGSLSRNTTGVVLHLDRSERAVEFASSVRGPGLTGLGPGCPDHLGTAGYRPMVLAPPDPADPQAVRDDLRARLEQHRAWYNAYFDEHVPEASKKLGLTTDAPRAVVIPGIGVVTSGSDGDRAELTADHFDQTMIIIAAADACGGYSSLTERQGAEDEYWPMIRLKPQLQPPTGPLSGRVVLVVGEDPDRAAEVARGLVRADAHVLVAGPAGAGTGATVSDLSARYGRRRALAEDTGNDAAAAVRAAVLAYGGFDGLIDLSLEEGLLEAAFPVLAAQGLGGAVLLANPDWGTARLRAEIDRWEPQLAARQVVLGAVSDASPVAVAATATFLITSYAARNTWKGTVLEPGPNSTEEVNL